MAIRSMLFLCLILAIACFLRFYHINQRGSIYWDEAYYQLEARTARAALSWIRHHNDTNILPHKGLVATLVEKGCTYPTGVGKPLFITLLSAWALAVGYTREYYLFILSGVFGAATVFLLYCFVRPRYGEIAALAAALFLSVSGYHVIYSRCALSVIYSTFFLLAAVWCYCAWGEDDKKVAPGLFVCGIILSLAFMCHYNLLANLLLFGLYQIYRIVTAQAKDRSLEIRATLYFAVGFLTIPCMCEAGYRIINAIFSQQIANLHILTYFQFIVRQILINSGGTQLFSYFAHHDYLSYIKAYVVMQGVWLSAVFFASIFLFPFIRRRKFNFTDTVVYTQCVMIMIFWVINPSFFAARAICSILPFSAVLSSVSLEYVCQRPAGLNKPIFSVLLIALTVAGFAQSWQIVNIPRSPYQECAMFLKDTHQDNAVFNEGWVLFQPYLGRKIYANLDRISSEKDLKQFYGEGSVRYLVFDRSAGPVPPDSPFQQAISKLNPVKSFPNRAFASKFILAEFYPYGSDDYKLYLNNPDAARIDIYDLSGLYGMPVYLKASISPAPPSTPLKKQTLP